MTIFPFHHDDVYVLLSPNQFIPWYWKRRYEIYIWNYPKFLKVDTCLHCFSASLKPSQRVKSDWVWAHWMKLLISQAQAPPCSCCCCPYWGCCWYCSGGCWYCCSAGWDPPPPPCKTDYVTEGPVCANATQLVRICCWRIAAVKEWWICQLCSLQELCRGGDDSPWTITL